MPATTSTVALYCRISVDRSGHKESVGDQERQGRRYAAKTWPGCPIRVFADNSISAASGDALPGLDELRAAVEAGEVAHLWAVEQYRINRDPMRWFPLAAELDAAGITELHTDRDGVVRVTDDVAGIKAVLGAGEVRRLRKRVNDRLDELAAQGRPSGAVTFGYRHPDAGIKGPKRLEIVPEEAEIVREIADRVLSGWSLASITSALTARGVRGAKGGALTPSSVRKIVTNHAVAGKRVHRGAHVGDGNWEPILDESTWYAVRTKLAAPRVVACADGSSHTIKAAALRSNTGRRYTLTGGLAVCGRCGAALQGTLKQYRSGGTRVSRPYLICSATRGAGGVRGCGRLGTLLEPVEAHVLETLLEELDSPAFREALAAADDHAERREELVRELAAIDAQRGERAALWASGGMTMVEWQAMRPVFDARERAARAELAALPTTGEVDLDGVREAWPEMTLGERRALLRMFISRVVIHPATPGTRAFDKHRVTVEWVPFGA